MCSQAVKCFRITKDGRCLGVSPAPVSLAASVEYQIADRKLGASKELLNASLVALKWPNTRGDRYSSQLVKKGNKLGKMARLRGIRE